MKGKVKLNVLFPIATAVVALVWIYKGVTEYGLWEASSSPADGLFPCVIAAVLLLASVVNIINSFKEDGIAFDKRAMCLIAALALVYICTTYIGLLPALFIFYIGWLKLYAKVDWKNTIIATLVMFVIIYGGFQVGLKIRFPVGSLFKMMLS